MPTLAFKKIMPNMQKVLDVDRVKEELESTLEDVKQAMIDDFLGTVENWSTAVDFEGRKFIRPDELRVIVYPTGPGAEIWGYVNAGTRPHMIYPRPGKTLSFKGNYRARTSPGSLRSGNAGSSGPTIFSKGVSHPGTEARGFTGQVAEKYRAEFARLCRNGLRRATR